MKTVITNATIFTGDDVLYGKSILVENNRILAVGEHTDDGTRKIDLAGKNIAPGFIDIQINGGTERYFSQTPDVATLDDIRQACCAYATPFIVPTLISSPIGVILQAIDAVKQYRLQHPGILGMHLEGPFFHPEKRGAHNPEFIREPTNEEIEKILLHGKGVIKIMTIAPEMFTDEQIEMLLASGIVIAAGHTQMTYEQAQHYFSKGIHLVTHFYNAMTQMGHRECGMVGAVFDSEHVYASLILDGGHCHYAAARVAYRQKQEKLFLITDASFIGRRKKCFDWEGLKIEMIDGFYRDTNGNLAGAAISMPEAVKNAVDYIGASMQEAIEMATSLVARAIKMENQIGYIKPGYPACFTVFDDALHNVQSLVV